MTKSSKKLIFIMTSILMLSICGVVLLGKTYAEFQESVTAGITIEAETLHATLLDAEGNLLGGQDNLETLSEGNVNRVLFFEVVQEEDITNAEDAGAVTLHTEPVVVWDLNKIYQTAPMTLVNTGNMALQYTISVEGIEETLKEALIFEILSDGECYSTPFNGILEADTNNETISFAIRAHLEESKAAMAAGKLLENVVISIVSEQAE